MTISIRPFRSEQRKVVSELSVHQAQVGFVETIDTILNNIDNEVHGHIIINETEADGGKKVNQETVGFFLIDTAYAHTYDFCSGHDLGLRSFFIDKHHQGHGYGKSAVTLLSSYLTNQYPTASSVYLTVNCKNPSAKYCYETGGFKDTGELYQGGDFGPQHIMAMPLNG